MTFMQQMKLRIGSVFLLAGRAWFPKHPYCPSNLFLIIVLLGLLIIWFPFVDDSGHNGFVIQPIIGHRCFQDFGLLDMELITLKLYTHLHLVRCEVQWRTLVYALAYRDVSYNKSLPICISQQLLHNRKKNNENKWRDVFIWKLYEIDRVTWRVKVVIDPIIGFNTIDTTMCNCNCARR